MYNKPWNKYFKHYRFTFPNKIPHTHTHSQFLWECVLQWARSVNNNKYISIWKFRIVYNYKKQIFSVFVCICMYQNSCTKIKLCGCHLHGEWKEYFSALSMYVLQWPLSYIELTCTTAGQYLEQTHFLLDLFLFPHRQIQEFILCHAKQFL